jgi:C4-dicarboxylate transporter, DctM subunit
MVPLMVGLSKWLDVICNKISTFFCILSGLLITITGLIVTYEIIARSIFKSPTVWVMEVSIIFSIASVFLGLAFTEQDKSHISVDLITSRLCWRDRIMVEMFTTILAMLYVLILTWQGAMIAIEALMVWETGPTVLRIPVFIPRLFLPLGAGLLLLELFRTAFHLLVDASTGQKGEINEAQCFPRGIASILLLAVFIIGAAMIVSKAYITLGIVILLFLLLFAGMPVATAMGLLGMTGFFFAFGGVSSFVQVPLVAFKVLDDFILVAIPLFLMTSTVMMVGGIGVQLFELASKWVRHLPGGLAVATMLACTLFAAISGSSVATVATIGLIAIPAMLERGYPKEFVYGTLAIGGVLGPLIPPSVFMLVIGSMTGDSVGKLFMAGMLPGLMLSGVFCVYIITKSMRDKSVPKMAAVPWKERWVATGRAFWGLMTPVLILGGIYTGIFTPTEAAGVGVTYGLIVSVFIYREVNWSNLKKIFIEGGKFTSMILFMVIGAILFGQVVAMMEIPQIVCNYLADLPLSPMAILFCMLGFVLFLGALMDELSILLIIYPTLYYIFVQHFKFDPIWFALVFVFTLEVGLVAPPVGINIFVVQGLDKNAKFEDVVKGVWPYVVLMVLCILAVVYIKPLSLWLPGMIG